MKNLIIQHLRNEDNVPFATFIATKEADQILIAFSKCCKSDNFSKAKGVHIAKSRLDKGSKAILPFAMRGFEAKFKNRCKRYFICDNFVANYRMDKVI